MTPIRLHIGLTKTGSTSLQAALQASEDALASHGVVYPTTARSASGAHHNLFYELAPPEHHEKFQPSVGTWSELSVEIDGGGNVGAIVSSEAFQYADEHTVRRLAEVLAGREVDVVAYLRRQDHWLEAAWNQRARFARVPPDFHEWVARSGARLADYAATLGPWIRAFGDARVDVRVYDRLDGGVDTDFFGRYTPSGIEAPDLPQGPKNTRAGRKQLRAAALVHEAMYGCAWSPTGIPAPTARRISEYFRPRESTAGGSRLTAREAADLLRTFEASNHALATMSTSFREAGGFPEPEFDDRTDVDVELDADEHAFLDRLVSDAPAPARSST